MSNRQSALHFNSMHFASGMPDILQEFYSSALCIPEGMYAFIDTDGPPDPSGAGLFHTAFLYPDRRSLALAALRLTALGIPIQGASDHDVSEAIYLEDPEGNGIEIYADRAEDEWQYADDDLRMGTHPLNLQDLIQQAGDDALAATRETAPREPFQGPHIPWADLLGSASELPDQLSAGTRPIIGHVHLRALDLGTAEQFWTEQLGLAVTTRIAGVASFLSVAAYHHHIGVNRFSRWTPRAAGAPGLTRIELSIPGADGAVLGTFTTPEGIAIVAK